MLRERILIFLILAIFGATALNGQVIVKKSGNNGHNLVVKNTADTSNSSSIASDAKDPDEETIQIIPTPVQNDATLTFWVKRDSYITIDLLDITGLRVKNLISAYYNKGWKSENISTSDLSPGRYIMVFQSTDEKKIVPFVILR